MHQDVFESEMKCIHDNGYHVVSVADLLRFLKHEITLPPGSVVITIDDGYKSAIVYAAPILKKYGYPWTFFIYPDFITVNESSGAASWRDLLALQAEGVDIESHSMTHPKLSSHHQLIKKVWHNFTPEEYDAWLTNETAGAKALLEKKMGKPITCFAYPFGDYNKEVKAKAIAAGYEAIFTVAGNPVHSTTDPHSIGRYTITQEEVKNFAADLRQGALGLTKIDPEPGATVTNPRPVISAELEPMSADKIDPQSIKTSVYDFDVRHDFDPQTNTVRLYLPRDLIQQVVLVNIRVKDAATGQTMVANWHFNYEPGGAAAIHPPIAPAVHSPSASTKNSAPNSKTTASATTNAPEVTEPEPLEKSALGTPLDPHPALPLNGNHQ
jgi:peptidoglycan/xylan/chitin deacetylase (PgdA/CDA1 family)